jgi:hypothetical protein
MSWLFRILTPPPSPPSDDELRREMERFERELEERSQLLRTEVRVLVRTVEPE